jgi:PAS domain S-box-containing protein
VTVSKVRLALRESEARFRSVMESAIDAIISADSRGVIRSWNSAATALFGHTASEAVGRKLELVIPDRFRDLHRTGIHRVSSGGETHVIGSTVELAALRKDGSEIPIELSHFETMHVLMKPTMQSKYPPAQGLVLAAGQALTGQAITAVWASFALACVALYWCLRPWTPRRWAFFGGLLPCLRFGTGLYFHDNHWTYWASSYWGGAVALLGGCLVLGSAVRLIRTTAGKRESLLLGLGLSILATSRPWEGLALAAPVLLLLIWRLGKNRGLPTLVRLVGPA